MQPSPPMLNLLHQIKVNGYEVAVSETLPTLGKVTVRRAHEPHGQDYGFSAQTEREVAEDLARSYCTGPQRAALMQKW